MKVYAGGERYRLCRSARARGRRHNVRARDLGVVWRDAQAVDGVPFGRKVPMHRDLLIYIGETIAAYGATAGEHRRAMP